MLCVLKNNKKAIKTGGVFRGLCVDNRKFWRKEFLKDRYKLLAVYDENSKELAGYVIYEEVEPFFRFHLVNFTQRQLRTAGGITERFMKGFVFPFCQERGLKKVICEVERRGMARKLERLGFAEVAETGVYIGRVPNVL
tara:strand:+ start:483 stop:899 length:417 start_codon:yes stop_codon:yes gene_type:complete